MKTLENIKPGDWVKMQVTEIVEGETYPIQISAGEGTFMSFTKNGEHYEGEKQIIFPIEEHEQPAFKERWMMVSQKELQWYKRKVIIVKNGKYISWNNAETDEEVEKEVETIPWNFAKEIEEEQPKELTLEERVKILEEKLSKL